MAPLDPHLDENIGHDALNIWHDFWELTGRLRVNVLRREESGGDPGLMINPDVDVTTIPCVPAILVGRDDGMLHDRAGEIETDRLRIEFIDAIHETDRISMYGIEYEVESVQEKPLGNMSVWVVVGKRIG